MIRRLLAIIITGIAVCGGLLSGKDIEAVEVSDLSILEFTTVSKGYYSGYKERGSLVIKDEAAWHNLWAIHTSTISPSPGIPQIDFAKEIIIAVFQGEHLTGGYDIKITRIEETREEIIAYIEESVPEPGMMLIQALTQPYHIVKIDSGLAVKFIYGEKEEIKGRQGG